MGERGGGSASLEVKFRNAVAVRIIVRWREEAEGSRAGRHDRSCCIDVSLPDMALGPAAGNARWGWMLRLF